MSKAFVSAAREARGEKITFTLDGVEFAVAGSVNMLMVSELARVADMDAESAEGAARLAEFFEAALGVEEYKRFYKHTMTHGTDTDTLVAVMGFLIQETVGRPTERPSLSQPGPSTTGPTSKVVSLSKGKAASAG